MKLIRFINELFNPKCKFHKKCPYFEYDSYTCKNGGGNYCGKYRELNRK